ncbi:hypothetical protein L3Q82_024309, partial [Scortum barcoo]
MKPRLNFLAIIPKSIFGTKTNTAHHQKNTKPYSEAWWWQHHALGLFFFSWNWGLYTTMTQSTHPNQLKNGFTRIRLRL